MGWRPAHVLGVISGCWPPPRKKQADRRRLRQHDGGSSESKAEQRGRNGLPRELIRYRISDTPYENGTRASQLNDKSGDRTELTTGKGRARARARAKSLSEKAPPPTLDPVPR